MSALQRVATSGLFTPASRVVRDIERNGGFVPSLSALRKWLQGRGWSGEEVAALWAELVAWSNLRLERQKLRDIIAADEGKAAKWSCGYSQSELEKLGSMGNKLHWGKGKEKAI